MKVAKAILCRDSYYYVLNRTKPAKRSPATVAILFSHPIVTRRRRTTWLRSETRNISTHARQTKTGARDALRIHQQDARARAYRRVCRPARSPSRRRTPARLSHYQVRPQGRPSGSGPYARTHAVGEGNIRIAQTCLTRLSPSSFTASW